MADDERRAEIEAVARSMMGVTHGTAMRVAERAIAALDRVRDARGDDERLPDEEPHYSCTRDHCSEDKPEECWAAPSPQGEDHECHQCDERRDMIEAAAAAIRHVINSYCPAWDRRIDWDRPDYAEQSRIDARFILDRVRDARGDDDPDFCSACGLARTVEGAEAYLSPQSEDHEAGIEAAGRALCALDNERDERRDHEGTMRPASLLTYEDWRDEWDEEARVAVTAYLSRVSPSRDGTVAVEDVQRCTGDRAPETG